MGRASVLGPFCKRMTQERKRIMSDLTVFGGLDIDFNEALKDTGITIAPVVGGAVVSEFAIERLKLDPSRKTRVAFLTNGGLAFQQHYVPGFGNILCNGKECCKRIQGIPEVQTTQRILFPVVEYLVADPVRATVHDISLRSIKVKVFAPSVGVYNKRMADNFASGMGVQYDWSLMSTNGQFQGALESMSPCGDCLYKQIPEVVEYVQRILKDNMKNLFDAIGKPLDVAAFEAFLKNPNANKAVGSAPATPKAPAIPASEAVDRKALQDEFAL